MKTLITLLRAAVVCALPGLLLAAPQKTVLTPMEHAKAEIVVVRPDGTEARYTPAELETFPTYRMETTTPWRDAPAMFEGVLLADILAENGLSEADAIMVTAENDFTSTIPRAVWQNVDVMVVTRVDGAPHSRRARGPIQFVVDMDTYRNSGLVEESHLVWMAARIEAFR